MMIGHSNNSETYCLFIHYTVDEKAHDLSALEFNVFIKKSNTKFGSGILMVNLISLHYKAHKNACLKFLLTVISGLDLFNFPSQMHAIWQWSLKSKGKASLELQCCGLLVKVISKSVAFCVLFESGRVGEKMTCVRIF